MEIQHATRAGCLVVAFTGRIDLASVAQVQRTLLKHISKQPTALICDLAGVSYLDPVFATVFSTVANHPASRWPTTNLLLCNARPQVATVLARVQPSHLLALYDTLQEALAAARARPAHLREELRLTPIPTAAGVAWAFVREVCQAWQLARPDETLLDRAVLVANELVTNAVVHAESAPRVLVHVRPTVIHVEISDDSDAIPVVKHADPHDTSGRGMAILGGLSDRWGSRRRSGGGKTVWFDITRAAGDMGAGHR